VTSTTDKIAIIGAGSIGIAFALLFAQAEYQIHLHDSDKQSLMSAKERLARQARLLAEGTSLKRRLSSSISEAGLSPVRRCMSVAA
jgi:3-hydroxyacyl-CoA dehydrogenase